MPAALAGPLARIRAVLSTISLGQKVVIGLLLLGLVLGGFFFYSWITAPTYSPLFSNLASTDASAIVDELDAEGVTYQLTDGGGTIMVPKDQVYDLRLTMSGKGLPAGKDTGYALLDQQGITTSEFQQQVTYQRAIEGELASTLEAIKGVNTAVVHLAIPKDQVFVADQAKPTASVLLDLAAGTQLDGEQIQAVTNLVSSSVENMDPTDVTVADSAGQVLSDGTGVTAAAGDQRSAMETEYETRLAAGAQKILDSVLGPNHAVVSVRADLDLSQSTSTSETHSYNQGTPPVSEQSSSETYTGTGTAVGGVLGPDTTGTTGNGGTGDYSKKETTTNNSVDTTTTTTQNAPGSINRLTVSVVMDGTVAGNLNQPQVQALIGNAVGLDTARGDAITVAAMPFDTTAAKDAQAEIAAARAADQQARTWSLVKNGAIGLGILVVVLLVWLRSRRRNSEEEDQDYEPLELGDDMLAELDRLRVASTREETAVIDNAALELEAAERARVRGEISQMVSDKPDEVAAMLRGWLSETPSKS
jgi:flagellar M-ring protein FliF